MCVNVNGSFGVVCLLTQGPWCTTCKVKCKHVSYLLEAVRDLDASEESSRLKMFALHKQPHPEEKKKLPAIKVMSQMAIPFDLTMSSKASLKEDYSQRFNISNGTANLIPPQQSASCCTLCIVKIAGVKPSILWKKSS